MSQQDAPALPTASLKLGGKELTLKMGYLCLVSLQKHWKLKSYRDVQAHIAENMEDLETIGAIIWGMTRSHHKEMSLDDVYAFIDGADDLGQLMEAVGDALGSGSAPVSPGEGQADQVTNP